MSSTTFAARPSAMEVARLPHWLKQVDNNISIYPNDDGHVHLELVPRCNLCRRHIAQYSGYYHCLGDHDNYWSYDICTDCSHDADTCQENDHSWKTSHVNQNGEIEMGRKTSAILVANQLKSYPTLFQSEESPKTLFVGDFRFVNKADCGQMLIFTDGACSGNGDPDAIGAYGFVYSPSRLSQTDSGAVSGRLESRGPTGESYTSTSIRAELRAVIAALQYRDWGVDTMYQWTSLVIATDSTHVAEGATTWIKKWESNGWHTYGKQPVDNQDLWQLLMKETRRLHGLGVSIFFWRIPREFIKAADQAAKGALTEPDVLDFTTPTADDPVGIFYMALQV